MKIVIEIPEDIYNEWCNMILPSNKVVAATHVIIKDGTPLPSTKGNSFIALCDTECVLTDKIISCLKDSYFVGRKEYCNYCFQIAEIIDADRGEEG